MFKNIKKIVAAGIAYSLLMISQNITAFEVTGESFDAEFQITSWTATNNDSTITSEGVVGEGFGKVYLTHNFRSRFGDNTQGDFDGQVRSINNDGVIKIAASDQSKSDHAKSIIEEITAGPQVDKIYEGKVAKIMDFGAFVAITPNKDGLVHISQISEERVKDVKDVLSEGDVVKVKVLEVDKQGRVKLTMKGVDQNT